MIQSDGEYAPILYDAHGVVHDTSIIFPIARSGSGHCIKRLDKPVRNQVVENGAAVVIKMRK